MGAEKYTATEQRIIEVLSDGLLHTRKEIHKCLNDDLAALNRIQQHISNMRKKLRPKGEDIVCQLYSGTIGYRHVRLLKSPYDGSN